MKILVISAAMPPMNYGESEHALYLCRRLCEAGHAVDILTTNQANISSSEPFLTYSVMRDWSWADFARLTQIFKRSKPDAILLLYTSAIYNFHPMITFAPSVSKALLPGVSFVTQFEHIGAWFPSPRTPTVRLGRRAMAIWAGRRNADPDMGTLLHESDSIVVLNEAYANLIAERDPTVRQKTILIPPPPLLPIVAQKGSAARQRGREMLGIKSDDLLIAYFGFVMPKKGIDVLLKAFQVIAERRENVRLVMIGGVPKNEFAQEMTSLAKQLKLDDKVIWVKNYETDSELPSLCLCAADIAALPYDEGVTLNRSSFAAAAAHGLPIVTTRGKILESPFVDGRNALLVEPENPDALASALNFLIDKPDFRHHLSAGASELADEWFSWNRAVERTMEMLSVSPKVQ